MHVSASKAANSGHRAPSSFAQNSNPRITEHSQVLQEALSHLLRQHYIRLPECYPHNCDL